MNGRRFSIPIFVLVALAAAACSAAAHADEMYKCPGENGVTEYKNNGSTKGCVRINVDPVVIPKGVNPNAKNTLAAPSPGGFPKVDSGMQKSRDSDRRRILEDELRDKETQLGELKREYNNGEPERQGNERNYQRYLDRTDKLKSDIARTESDIASIRSEISKVP